MRCCEDLSEICFADERAARLRHESGLNAKLVTDTVVRNEDRYSSDLADECIAAWIGLDRSKVQRGGMEFGTI